MKKLRILPSMEAECWASHSTKVIKADATLKPMLICPTETGHAGVVAASLLPHASEPFRGAALRY
jgi:hypothetical protein